MAYKDSDIESMECLLHNQFPTYDDVPSDEPCDAPKAPKEKPFHGYRALPIAFLASCAMAVTAASTVFAYAHIVCQDAEHCSDHERASYTSSVAVATTIANAFSLVAMGLYERLPARAALLLWIGLRAGSVVVLAVSVFYRSIPLALAARVLEGLATDNVLHMRLNALYTATPDQRTVSHLMMMSLALYMVGMSLSPALAALLPDFHISFAIAIGIFLIAAIYLCVAGPLADDERRGEQMARGIKELARPITYLFSDKMVAGYGVAILLYNTAVSYLFPALMIYATLQFGFSPGMNGLLLSVAAGSSAVYLLVAAAIGSRRNDISALIALMAFVGATCGLAGVSLSWLLFPGVAVVAGGLTAPSFIKAHMVERRPQDSMAVAALAIAEGFGSLLAPSVLGSWQVLYPGSSVLYVVAGLALGSAAVFLALTRYHPTAVVV